MRFTVEDAKLIYLNFSGKPTPFNPVGGVKQFGVVLPPDLAEKMKKDGWNVRYREDKGGEEGNQDEPYISVAARFDIKPPRVVMITSTGKIPLGEKEIEVLDWADIQTADLIVQSSYWNNNGKEGYKAYLKTLVVTIEEDYLEKKYGINEPVKAMANGDFDD
jgi:hypothetical protein